MASIFSSKFSAKYNATIIQRKTQRAAQHGHSIEAEMRNILEAAVKPQDRVKLGSMLADIGQKARLTQNDLAIFESGRNKSLARAASFDPGSPLPRATQSPSALQV